MAGGKLRPGDALEAWREHHDDEPGIRLKLARFIKLNLFSVKMGCQGDRFHRPAIYRIVEPATIQDWRESAPGKGRTI
jgi:hypothetical protein